MMTTMRMTLLMLTFATRLSVVFVVRVVVKVLREEFVKEKVVRAVNNKITLILGISILMKNHLCAKNGPGFFTSKRSRRSKTDSTGIGSFLLLKNIGSPLSLL